MVLEIYTVGHHDVYVKMEDLDLCDVAVQEAM